MEDQTVGDQMVVFDGLPLLIPAVLRDDAFAAEESPLEEAVEGFALVCGTLDGRPQMRVRDIAKQEAGADDSSKFAKGLIEAVLAAAGSQPAKDRRGADATGLYGENDAQHVGEMRLDQVPVDVLGEERVDVVVTRLGFPVADAGASTRCRADEQARRRAPIALACRHEERRAGCRFRS